MRSLPGKRKGTPSAAQVEQQMKFATMIKFQEAFLALLTRTFVDPAGMLSPGNYAMRHNLKDAITGVYLDFSVDYHKVLLSLGKLHNAGAANAEGNGAGKIKFNWVDNSSDTDSAKATDKSILIAYCAETNESVFTLNGPARSTETAVLNVSLFSGKAVETWLAFISEDGKLVARNTYLGNVMVE